VAGVPLSRHLIHAGVAAFFNGEIMTVYVISTMTNSVSYCRYRKVGDLPILQDKVTIRGGAGLPSLKSGFGDQNDTPDGIPMWTAEGMVTPVSDENFDILKEHWLFVKHQEQGFIKVIKHDILGNYKAVKHEVADGMTKKDAHAQLTAGDIKGRKITVKTITAEETELDTRI
jgi:hypothetical protein